MTNILTVIRELLWALADTSLGFGRHLVSSLRRDKRLNEFRSLHRKAPPGPVSDALPQTQIRRLVLSCGDASGEAHALRLVAILKQRHPGIEIEGFGGKALENQGVTIWEPLADLNIMGFKDVLKQLPLFFKCVFRFSKELRHSRPDAVVLIDYPGLNRHLLRVAWRRRIPVVDYIAPQLWAWAPWRVREFRKADRLLTILPFENDWYQKRGAHPEYVGHPLGDRLSELQPSEEAEVTLDSDATWVGILPGSRQREIRNNLPLLLEAARELRLTHPEVRFVLPHLRESAWPTIRSILSQADLLNSPHFVCAPNAYYTVLPQLQAAWVTSGTAVLETAAHRVPPVLLYHVPSAITHWLYRRMLAVPWVGGLNLVAGTKLCPEHLGHKIHPRALAHDLAERLNGPERERVLEGIDTWLPAFGRPGSAARAAQAIESALR